MMPRFTIEYVRKRMETTFPTANAAVKLMEQLGVVAEITGGKKNRRQLNPAQGLPPIEGTRKSRRRSWGPASRPRCRQMGRRAPFPGERA